MSVKSIVLTTWTSLLVYRDAGKTISSRERRYHGEPINTKIDQHLKPKKQWLEEIRLIQSISVDLWNVVYTSVYVCVCIRL